MKKINPQNAKNWIKPIPPLVLATIAISFQLTNNNSLSPRELNLVNAVLYFSSLWFGAVVAYWFSEKEFQEKQKKFALSAYRRIGEMETNLTRLLNRLTQKLNGDPKIGISELDILREMALNLQTTTQSSKADWVDIIGEEIKIIKEIKEIEQVQKSETVPNQESQQQKERLFKKLPSSLEIQTREMLSQRESLEINAFELIKELDKKGYIELDGFWDSSFDVDIFTLPIGAEVYISMDDVGGRRGALIAHDKNGDSLGVITNKLIGTSSYLEFVSAVILALNKSKFSAEYFEKDGLYKQKRKESEERHYFKIKVKKESVRGGQS